MTTPRPWRRCSGWRLLLQPYSFRNTIMLAAFDMEEMNQMGSKKFVSQLASARKICGAIIYEAMAYS
jgi:hypothetical protein